MPGNKVIPSFPGWVSSNFILWETGAIALGHPRTQRLRSLCRAVGNERPPWKDAILGAYHLAKKSGNFRWKSNGTENPFENCGSPLFPFGTELRKLLFPYQLHDFSVPVSHRWKTKRGNRISNSKRQLVRLVCWFWKIPYHYSMFIPSGSFRQMVSPLKVRKYRTSGWIAHACIRRYPEINMASSATS